jgi:hypothetical protein
MQIETQYFQLRFFNSYERDTYDQVLFIQLGLPTIYKYKNTITAKGKL